MAPEVDSKFAGKVLPGYSGTVSDTVMPGTIWAE